MGWTPSLYSKPQILLFYSYWGGVGPPARSICSQPLCVPQVLTALANRALRYINTAGRTPPDQACRRCRGALPAPLPAATAPRPRGAARGAGASTEAPSSAATAALTQSWHTAAGKQGGPSSASAGQSGSNATSHCPPSCASTQHWCAPCCCMVHTAGRSPIRS